LMKVALSTKNKIKSNLSFIILNSDQWHLYDKDVFKDWKYTKEIQIYAFDSWCK
jgi:hypothetical protein